ncbi:MAG: hypothetical protein WKF74_09215 [Pyrinomonadaceae bacterium]
MRPLTVYNVATFVGFALCGYGAFRLTQTLTNSNGVARRGAAFVMNSLTCITWFVLTLVLLAISALFLVFHRRLGRERAFWQRGARASSRRCSTVFTKLITGECRARASFSAT